MRPLLMKTVWNMCGLFALCSISTREASEQAIVVAKVHDEIVQFLREHACRGIEIQLHDSGGKDFDTYGDDMKKDCTETFVSRCDSPRIRVLVAVMRSLRYMSYERPATGTDRSTCRKAL